MKLAIFSSSYLRFGAIAAGEWCQQMLAEGHDAALWATGFDDSFAGLPCRELPCSEIAKTTWWARHGFDLVQFYSLRGFAPEVLRAAKQTGATVVLECDSDGFVSPRQAPVRFCKLRWDPQLPVGQRLRSVKAALDEWVDGSRFERRLLDVMEAVDWIKIESDRPAQNLKKFLHSRGRADLAGKVVVVPFAVRRVWSDGAVRRDRPGGIVVGGRLGASQKNPVRLAAVLSRLVQEMPGVEIQVHVRGEASDLEGRLNGLPGLRLFRDSSPETLAAALRSSRVLLSVSRWETTPVQGLEALCSGCTLVAPGDVPGYVSLIEEGRFGQTFRSGGEVGAIQAELTAWEKGERDPEMIAETWRKRCALDVVCGQIRALRGGSEISTAA